MSEPKKFWADKENQIYSERQDLTPETFALLVQLTLRRRLDVTKENLWELWERDQRELEEAIAGGAP